MSAPADTLRVPLSVDTDGVTRVSGSRVTLHSIVRTFESGASAEEIASKFPPVPLGDVYAVIAWYLTRRDEVNATLRREDVDATSLRSQIEHVRSSSTDLRDALIRRRASR